MTQQNTPQSRTSTPSSLAMAKDYWDAGPMGCGELILQLKIRFKQLCGNDVLHLRAEDNGAPEDIPAWCRMTGHGLLHQQHPDYWIQKKGDNDAR